MARRLRAVPRAARCHGRELSWRNWPGRRSADRDPRCARRRPPPAHAARCCSISTRQWIAETQWQEARAAAARAWHRARSATCRSSPGPTAPRSGPACRRVPSRRLGRRAARRLQRHGPGLGPADLPLGRDSRPTATRGCASGRRRMAALYDGLRVDHVIGLYPDLRPAAHRRTVLHPGATSPTRSRRASAVMRILAEGGLVAHCRGPRRRARLRAAVAGARWACRAAR